MVMQISRWRAGYGFGAAGSGKEGGDSDNGFSNDRNKTDDVSIELSLGFYGSRQYVQPGLQMPFPTCDLKRLKDDLSKELLVQYGKDSQVRVQFNFIQCVTRLMFTLRYDTSMTQLYRLR